MISVRIPIKDGSQYLESCLDSVESQTYKDIEILLGIEENEETLSKAMMIRNNYNNLRIFWSPEAKGVGATVNTLSYAARGDYLIYFDSDDIMMPTMVDTISRNRNTADIVRIRCSEFSDTEDVVVPSRIIGGGVFGITRNKFKEMGGYANMNGAEDTEFIERARKMGVTVGMIETPGYLKRYRTDGVSLSPETRSGSKLNDEYCFYIANVKGEKLNPVFSSCKEIHE